MFSTWQKYVDIFPAGRSFPLALISNVSVPSDVFAAAAAVNITNVLIQDIQLRSGIAPELFSGPTWVQGQPIDILRAVDLLIGNDKDTPLGIYAQFRNLAFNHINVQESPFLLRGFYTEIDVPWDPQGGHINRECHVCIVVDWFGLCGCRRAVLR